MSNTGDSAVAVLRHPIAKGWIVHCVTASGAICGMLGIIAVSDKQPREAVLWLAAAMILDGVDARQRAPGRCAITCRASMATRWI